jgi:hypothetical protein
VSAQKPAKVVAQYRRFRVFRLLSGAYALQVKALSAAEPDQWVTIELYDYYSNARPRAKQMDAIMDGWSKFEP